MKRFYSTNIQSNFIYLENEEAQHCAKVLRCKENETIEVLNGNGILYQGIISSIQKHEVQITIQGITKEAKENPNRLSIAICPTKNPSRLEWFLEKATEIGIANIYPIISERTEKQSIKQDRLAADHSLCLQTERAVIFSKIASDSEANIILQFNKSAIRPLLHSTL